VLEEWPQLKAPRMTKLLGELDASKTLLSGLIRTATTDEHARRWFRRYWSFGVRPVRLASRARGVASWIVLRPAEAVSPQVELP
jgi:hypothetical protein